MTPEPAVSFWLKLWILQRHHPGSRMAWSKKDGAMAKAETLNTSRLLLLPEFKKRKV